MPSRLLLLRRALGWALVQPHDRTGAMDDVDEAIQCFERASDVCPPGHPARQACLDGLGSALLLLYITLRNLEDMTRVVKYHQEALCLGVEGGLPAHTSLRHLANAFFYRFQDIGEMTDIEESTRFCENFYNFGERHTTFLYSVALSDTSTRSRVR